MIKIIQHLLNCLLQRILNQNISDNLGVKIPNQRRAIDSQREGGYDIGTLDIIDSFQPTYMYLEPTNTPYIFFTYNQSL
mgnify:CR=1 FL=1